MYQTSVDLIDLFKIAHQMLTKLGSGNQNWKTQLSVEIDPDQPTLVNSAGQATQYWPASGEEMKFPDGMILSNQSEKLLRGHRGNLMMKVSCLRLNIIN